MNHLFSCLKRYLPESILAPLFKLFEAGMELLVPLAVANVVDIGVATGDRGYILHACLVLVAFGVAGLAFALTAQYFAARAAVGCSAELRSRLFCKMQTFSFTRIDGMGTSSMLTRMTSDVNQVQTGVNLTLRLLLRSPIVVAGATAMAFLVDAKAALVFLGLIPFLFLVVFGVMFACIPKYKKVQEELDGVYLSTRENLVGARVIRAFRLEDEEIQSFERKTEKLVSAQERVGKIAALTAPLTFVLVEFAVIVLIYLGAIRVDAGALEQGQVVALYSYLSLILVELIKFANFIVTTAKAASAAKRIAAVLDTEGEKSLLQEEQSPVEGAPHVSFTGVSFTYAGSGGSALSGVTFAVNKGETVGILGGTGAGKSTLVRLIPRFYEATEGEVALCGVPVGAIPAEKLRERIGYVPQKTVLFRGTIASNLRWGNQDASDAELLRACEIAQALDVVEAKGGLAGEIAQGGRNLSGGQRQRLTIARALVKNPELLILDDSASALDYATDARLRSALKGLGCTVFLVSQRVASVMGADQIIVLDEGRIADMGTHDELLARCELYREIYRSQTEETA